MPHSQADFSRESAKKGRTKRTSSSVNLRPPHLPRDFLPGDDAQAPAASASSSYSPGMTVRTVAATEARFSARICYTGIRTENYWTKLL